MCIYRTLLCGTALLAQFVFNPALAAERTVAITDLTGRGFASDIVTYAGDANRPARLRVFDAAGKPVAAQADGATLSFVTSLDPGAVVRYTVRDDGKGDPPPATAVFAKREAGTLTLANGLLAVRVPSEQKKTFKEPVPASDLPSPLLAFRGADGLWRGAAKMLTTRPVKAFSVALVAQGPVFCEVRYELTFAAGGFYRATLRVADRVPLVKVSEEYDPGVMDGTDGWELDLAAGWSPDRMEIANTAGNGQVDAGRVAPLTQLAKKPSWFLVPDNAWGPLSQLGLFAEADRQATPDGYPMAGIVPLHKGDWRHMNGIEIRSPDAATVRARFPMSRRYASWLREVTSETSPFSMQEHEPGQSLTYGRRHWGLVLAAPDHTCKAESGRATGPFYQARLFYGVVGLDRYKDFVTEWSDSGAVYPRLYLKADSLDAYQKNLETSGLPGSFVEKLRAGTFALGVDPAGLTKRTDGLIKRLDSIIGNVFISPTTGHHWTAGLYTVAATADDILGQPTLPLEARTAIRARIALICHLWQDAGILGFGGGSHTGNPNMGTARFAPLVAFLPLVPDHPRFELWRRHMAAYVTQKAAIQTAPGGGYFEFGAAYHMHGYSRIMNAIPALQAAGAQSLDHLLALDRANWAYYLNLLTPLDSRWKFRVIPGMANSPPGYTEHLLEAAGELSVRDPELAAQLAWAWHANGANDRNSPIGGMNGQLAAAAPAPREPALRSQIYPGVGVVFRAHQGPEETYLLFRAGNNWSHWNEDQGHLILMSRGATLLPFQPYQYWGVKSAAFDDHNVLRFGHPENKMPHAWPDANILDHAFGGSVEYAWSSVGFPDWFIEPGATPEFGGTVDAPVATGSLRKLAKVNGQKQGAFDWDRQILFMRGQSAASPNYFVIRDSINGEGQLASWLSLNLLGTKEGVTARRGSMSVDTEWPVKLDVLFPERSELSLEFHEENQPVALGGWSGPSWWRKEGALSKNWVDKEGAPLPVEAKGDFWEKHTLARIPAAPGEGYFWLLYPRTANEPAPTVAVPAPGVMSITHAEGTDYAFAAVNPFSYAAGGVLFEGCAGAVRVANDGAVTLALTGGHGKVGHRGTVLSGVAPFEKTFPAGALQAGETVLTPPLSADVARVIEAEGSLRFIAPHATYVKLTSGNVGVRGQGPFDLTFTADRIRGTVTGETRTIVTTWPAKIVRPMFHMDGQRWLAGWADDHSIAKGTAAPQFAFAFGVTAGEHTVEVSEWVYPDLPAALPRRRIGE